MIENIVSSLIASSISNLFKISINKLTTIDLRKVIHSITKHEETKNELHNLYPIKLTLIKDNEFYIKSWVHTKDIITHYTYDNNHLILVWRDDPKFTFETIEKAKETLKKLEKEYPKETDWKIITEKAIFKIINMKEYIWIKH